MRFHEPWTVFPRTMKSGRVIWYYRVWLAPGRRSPAYSTGVEGEAKVEGGEKKYTNKAAARDYCRTLEKAGQLLPADQDKAPQSMSFGELADGFWSWDPPSEYVSTRLTFSDPTKPAISEGYVNVCSRIVELHLLPTFRRRLVKSITPQEVEAFAIRLRDKKKLSGKRVNSIVSVMRTMLNEAYRAGVLPWDPKEKRAIRSLGNAPKRRGRLSLSEAKELFAPYNIDTAWKGHKLYRAINFVAAATGCRQGEILAIRDQDVFDNHIFVDHSWDLKYGLGPTKTRKSRYVPLLPLVRESIEPFLGSGGFVFSMSRGERPVTGNRVTEALYVALETIGVTDRKERNITFHSWRHWLNSTLRAEGIADDLIRRMTGHETPEMTDNYTEYDPDDYQGAVQVLERIFS